MQLALFPMRGKARRTDGYGYAEKDSPRFQVNEEQLSSLTASDTRVIRAHPAGLHRKKKFAFCEDECSLRQEVRQPCAFQRQ
jgi:hypothetical protein